MADPESKLQILDGVANKRQKKGLIIKDQKDYLWSSAREKTEVMRFKLETSELSRYINSTHFSIDLHSNCNNVKNPGI